MAAKPEVVQDKASKSERPPTKQEVARERHESTARWWIFRTAIDVVVVKARGQDEARKAAGQVSKHFALHYSTAGEALRNAEMQAEHLNLPIRDVASLESAAGSEPEPESGASLLHAARNAGK